MRSSKTTKKNIFVNVTFKNNFDMVFLKIVPQWKILEKQKMRAKLTKDFWKAV